MGASLSLLIHSVAVTAIITMKASEPRPMNGIAFITMPEGVFMVLLSPEKSQLENYLWKSPLETICNI